jgi:hypothetical protein
MVDIPSKIKYILKAAEISETVLGFWIGVSQKSINGWKLGKTTPHPNNVKNIDKFYKQYKRYYINKDH